MEAAKKAAGEGRYTIDVHPGFYPFTVRPALRKSVAEPRIFAAISNQTPSMKVSVVKRWNPFEWFWCYECDSDCGVTSGYRLDWSQPPPAAIEMKK